MDAHIIIGFLTIGALVVIQLLAFAFGYGKLHQKAKDHHDEIVNTKDAVKAVEKQMSEMNGTQRVHTRSLEIACASISKLESESGQHDTRLTKLEVKK